MPSYSLWLIPDEPERAFGQQLIESLAKEHGTTPFPPHVTLASISDTNKTIGEAKQLVEGLVKAKEFVAQTLLYTEAEAGTDTSPLYWRYRCVYARVEHSQQTFLQKMRSLALSALDAAEEPRGYMPHLSLIYSDMDASKRVNLAASLQHTITHDFFGGKFSTLELWETSGSVGQWEKLGEYQLVKGEESEE